MITKTQTLKWIERPALEVRQKPHRGDMWIVQGHQKLV